MSLENSILLQNQIRENSDELQNFLKDMDHWEKDMKKKEEELKLMNISDEQECPPIRNSLSRSKKRSRNKKVKDKANSSSTKETDEETKQRISSYNYKAWDKFDVESELNKLDEKKDSSASDDSDNEETLNMQSKRQLAIIKKDNGNKFFKAGSYDSAINCYTIGMELDPENALLPANRAMAFLKKEQFQAAENDCTLCLSLDPTYVKAYLRRGTARTALKKFSLAESDFLKVLEIEPDNKQAQLELEKINKENFVEQNKSDVEFMEMQEVVSEVSNYEESNGNVSEEKCFVCEHFSLEERSKVPCQECFVKLNVTNYTTDEFFQTLPDSKNVCNESEESKSNIRVMTNEVAIEPSIERMDMLMNETKMNNIDLCGIKDVVSALEQTLPPVPSASYQFLTDWKRISKYPDLKYSYLKQIPPDTLQVLFKHYVEPELFPEILHTLSTSFIENGEDVYHYMKYLATVGRFDTMLMFLSKNEKEDLKKLMAYLKISGYESSEVNAILKLYHMQ